MLICFRSSAVVLSLMLVTPAFAAIRYFPSPPGDDEGDNTIDYDIGTFSLVVVGFEPDQNSPDSVPFPYTKPIQTVLKVVDGGVINCNTFVYNDSILNVSGGTLKDIYASYDPTIDGPLESSNATVLISGGSVGAINGYHNDQIVVSGGIVKAVSVMNHGTIQVTGGQVDQVQAVGSTSSAALLGGTITNDVYAGSNNLALIDWGGTAEIDGASVGGSIYAQGSGVLTLTSGTVNGIASASENATLNLNGGVVNGDVVASLGSIVSLGSTKIGGSVAVGGNATFIGGASGGSIAKGITTLEYATVSLSAERINGPLNLGGNSTTYLTGCSVTSTSDPAVLAISSSKLTIGGASTVTGDVYANDTSTITLQGSVITGNVYAAGGTINLNGGIINGHVTLLGGTFNYSGGIVTQNVSGMIAGLVASGDKIVGAAGANSLGFTIEDGGVLNIYGTGFTYQLLDAHYLNQFSEYSLTGYLADGTYINDGTFLVLNNSDSKFALLPPVPEPATVVLVLPAAFALLLRRRSVRKSENETGIRRR